MKRIKLLFFLLISIAALSCAVLLPAPPEVFSLRLQRLLTAFLVGGALSLSGNLTQVLFRNDLATPYTLGVSGGATLGAFLVMISGVGNLVFSVPCGAFSGAVLAFLLVLVVGRFGRFSSTELLLGGVVVGTVLSGVLIYLVSVANFTEIAGVNWWMLGDLSSADALGLLLLGISSVVALVVMRLFANDLNAMAFGDEGAAFLGVSVAVLRLILLGFAALLVSLAVALAGMIGFVGLIVPHIIRKITGSDQRYQILPVYSGGGLFLMLCDQFGRWLDPVRQLPPGVLTAIFGGALFLTVLYRRNRGVR